MVLPQVIGGGLGALQGGLQGGWKGALLGGALGAAVPGVGGALGRRLAGTALASKLGLALGKGQGALTGLAGKVTGTGMGQGLLKTGLGQAAAGLGTGAAMTGTAKGLGTLASGAYMLGGMPGLNPAARAVGGGLGGLGQGAAGIIGYNSVTGEPMYGAGVPGSALPPGMGQFGGVDPYGSPLDVLSATGLDAGRRLRMQKDAEAQRDAMNVLLPTLRKFSEQAKKDEFARSMAGKGISQNILTNAALTQAAQQAGLQMGTTAAQQAGSALTQRYTY